MFSAKSVTVILPAKYFTEVNSNIDSIMNQTYEGWLSQP